LLKLQRIPKSIPVMAPIGTQSTASSATDSRIPLHTKGDIDCEDGMSGQRKVSQNKKLVMFSATMVAFTAAGMIGFFVVGPSIQHAVVGSSGSNRSNGQKLGKFMAPGAPLVSRTRPLASNQALVAAAAGPQVEIELGRMQAEVAELQSQIEHVQTMVEKREESPALSLHLPLLILAVGALAIVRPLVSGVTSLLGRSRVAAPVMSMSAELTAPNMEGHSRISTLRMHHDPSAQHSEPEFMSMKPLEEQDAEKTFEDAFFDTIAPETTAPASPAGAAGDADPGALHTPPLPARPAAPLRADTSNIVMKHKDYFERVSRAEKGRLRLCVFRSNQHIYGQVIDDSKGHIVCAASTMEPPLRAEPGSNCGAADKVGKLLGERALAKGIEKVHFDRNGKKFHGRVKALAEGARQAGLSF
jgi:large subunit ribosomal protein L18